MRSGQIKPILIFLIASIGVFIILAPGNCKKREEKNSVKKTARIRFGKKTIEVEVADTSEKRERGLMFRESLPEDGGMLFVYSYPQKLSFWMKNTKIPLAIAYITSEYKITDILQMKPYDTETRYISSKEVKYALEMNAGWFNKNGIKTGDKIKKIDYITEKEK